MLTFQQELDKRQKQHKTKSIIQEERTFIENINTLNDIEHAEVVSVYQFAKNLKYKHPGLCTDYINHLLRMCNICIELCKSYQKDILVTILVHNVFEVTDLTFDVLSKTVGLSTAKIIESLTVDRSKEWDAAYKSAYYKNIAQNTVTACTKILDKIDNLFMIETNTDKLTREKYIHEIITYVIPMAAEQHNIPEGSKLLSNMVLAAVSRMKKITNISRRDDCYLTVACW